MKIAVDCRMSGKSGIGAFIDGILPYLKSSGHELFCFGGNEENSCSIKTFSLREIFCFPKPLLKKINECDVYLTPYCNIPGGIKIPVYSTIHDVVFFDVKGLASPLGVFARKLFFKRAVSRSKGIFTVSYFSKSRIEKTLSCRKPVYVVYSANPEYLNKPFGNSEKIEKDNSIIFIGNIKKHKGLSCLLEALEKIYGDNEITEKPVLKIVGSQDNFRTKDETIGGRIDAMNIKYPHSIVFTGFVSDNTLQELLATSKLLIQPSLYEGFGLPPLQALTNRTNALISDIEVFKEIYRDFDVHYFKCEDSQDLYLKARELLQNMPEVKTPPDIYSFKKTAEKILDAFKKDNGVSKNTF